MSIEPVENATQSEAKVFRISYQGQNFAIACSQYGETDKVTVRSGLLIKVFQATGGMTGKYISAYLDELGIEHITGMPTTSSPVPVSKTTRTCTTVLDKKSGAMTELIVTYLINQRNLLAALKLLKNCP